MHLITKPVLICKHFSNENSLQMNMKIVIFHFVFICHQKRVEYLVSIVCARNEAQSSAYRSCNQTIWNNCTTYVQ